MLGLGALLDASGIQVPAELLLNPAELSPAFVAFVALVFGLVIGSFLNAAIYRLPRAISVSRPRSFCPHCGNTILWYRNVPLFSYLLLRGRCGDCEGPISIRYPLVELTTGIVFAAAAWRWGISWSTLSAVTFASAMLALALIDVDFRILPNLITLPGIVIGLAFSLVDPRRTPLGSLLGIALGGGLLYSVAWLYFRVRGQEGMGMGDVKMMAMVGAFLGWQGALLTTFLGSLIGSVVGILMLRVKDRGWDYALPFGTFLALAAVIADWGGDALLAWYWRLLRIG